jgi:hypothetical protein
MKWAILALIWTIVFIALVKMGAKPLTLDYALGLVTMLILIEVLLARRIEEDEKQEAKA